MKRFASTLVIVALVACGKSRRTAESEENAGAPTGGTSAGSAGSSSGGRAGGATGGSSTGGSSTGGSSTGGSSTGGSSTGGTGATGDECVVVRRVDCCIEPFVVHANELANDECLIAWDHLDFGSTERDERCAATRPSGCSEQPCSQRRPPSRATAMDEEARCYFADECATAGDCVMAAQICYCCPCAQPTPATLLADACILGENEPIPDPNPAVVCPSGDCAACQRDSELSCNPTPRGLRRCESGPELPEDACTTERPCRIEAGVFCAAPGVPVCGGPPPPPDECATDVDCPSSGDPRICVPSGHCSQRVCEPGCVSDAECAGPEVCGNDHHCAPKPCSDVGTCGPNFDCNASGLCERRRCGATSICEGYCVNELCFDEPGTCQIPLP